MLDERVEEGSIRQHTSAYVAYAPVCSVLDERVEEGVKRLDVCFQQLQRRVRSVFRVLRALVSVTEFSLCLFSSEL